MLVCPVCRTRLKENRFGYACKKGHRFDLAAQGYVNLLGAKHSGSGDDPAMVKARTEFLALDGYRPLAEKTADIMRGLLEGAEKPLVLDCGCGEGYYTNIYAAALSGAEVFGMDISRAAVKHAASRAKALGLENVRYAAASSFELPFSDRSADIIVSTFAPVAGEEFARVLKKGGKLVIVCPAPEHLMGLRAVLYDEPYLNKPNDYGLKGFAEEGSERLEYTLTLGTNRDIMNLFAMTPYYYRTPREGRERLERLDSLETGCGFDIFTFRKK
ncbi:MAG: methyltransferase domain-containing protein [Ruminococcus sp.]|nr:methyltransferase domain-containing protein [Ruminococcus sp.]